MPKSTKSTPTRTTPRSNVRPSSKKASASESSSLTYAAFSKSAKSLPIKVQLDDGKTLDVEAVVKEFSSGSFGWSASKNAKIPVKGHGDVDVTISLNMTVKGSKPKDGETATPTKTPRTSSVKGSAKADGAKKRKAAALDDASDSDSD